MLAVNTNQNSSLLTVEELAIHLKVPTSTIYYWTSRKEIPVIPTGRHLRFNLDEVINHFKNKSQDDNQYRHLSKTTAFDNSAVLSSLKSKFAKSTDPEK